MSLKSLRIVAPMASRNAGHSSAGASSQSTASRMPNSTVADIPTTRSAMLACQPVTKARTAEASARTKAVPITAQGTPTSPANICDRLALQAMRLRIDTWLQGHQRLNGVRERENVSLLHSGHRTAHSTDRDTWSTWLWRTSFLCPLTQTNCTSRSAAAF